MGTWFSVRAVYDKTAENGIGKRVKELYLVDAANCADAETRTIGELMPFVTGDIYVSSVKVEGISEIFNQELDEGKWYKVKVAFVTVDEKSAKEKRTYSNILVFAINSDDAAKRFHKGMKGTLSDYKIHTIAETEYMDVFFYDLEKQSDETR